MIYVSYFSLDSDFESIYELWKFAVKVKKKINWETWLIIMKVKKKNRIIYIKKIIL